jgi:predicted CoA-binding protein
MDDARAFFAPGSRVAVMGVSRDGKDFSRYVLRELLRHGWDAVPVNPALREAEGIRAFARVSDVEPPPDAAIVMLPARRADEAVRDCLVARVRRIWFHCGGGPDAACPSALALCRANRVEVVQGLCPLMVLPGTSFPHRLHGMLRSLVALPVHGPAAHGL